MWKIESIIDSHIWISNVHDIQLQIKKNTCFKKERWIIKFQIFLCAHGLEIKIWFFFNKQLQREKKAFFYLNTPVVYFHKILYLFKGEDWRSICFSISWLCSREVRFYLILTLMLLHLHYFASTFLKFSNWSCATLFFLFPKITSGVNMKKKWRVHGKQTKWSWATSI